MPESATSRLRSLLLFPFFIVFSIAIQSQSATPPENPADRISRLLEQLASAPPDSCDSRPQENQDAHEIELSMLDETANLVGQQLNLGGSEVAAVSQRATVALNKIKAQSQTVNSAWPEENRFRFELLSIPPALVLKSGIATHERFFVFAIPPRDDSGKANQLWRRVDEDLVQIEHTPSWSSVKLYPLHRGPSGNARFLAAIGWSGCMGSSAITYEALEWNPSQGIQPNQIIKQDGAFGLDDGPGGEVPSAEHPFAPIGKLETAGAHIALPYCWFSAIDTWDNPSMCALDTYDLSGDTVRFYSRRYNRSDLLPVAKAIEYGDKHDYPAVLSYCASSAIARRIVRDIPPEFSAGDLEVKQIAEGRERVEVGFPTSYRFEVEKQGERWIVTGFSVTQ